MMMMRRSKCRCKCNSNTTQSKMNKEREKEIRFCRHAWFMMHEQQNSEQMLHEKSISPSWTFKMCVTNEKKGDVHCTCIRENKSYWLDVVAELCFFPFSVCCYFQWNETEKRKTKQKKRKSKERNNFKMFNIDL